MSDNHPLRPAKDGPEMRDLASRQRERILGSREIWGTSKAGSPNSSNLDWHANKILIQRGINTDPYPNVDQMVVLFLRGHDVDVRPPSGTKAGDAVAGAFFGAFGPAASFAGSHLRQQETIAALQEWTSWKQWALGHSDWPAFKEKIRHDHEENLKKAREATESEWFRSEYKESLDSQRRLYIDRAKILAVAIGSMWAIIGIAFFAQDIRRQFEPRQPESKPVYHKGE